jgi:hypothetical protein
MTTCIPQGHSLAARLPLVAAISKDGAGNHWYIIQVNKAAGDSVREVPGRAAA